MSSSDTGGVSESTPSQPNGYSRSYVLIAAAGTLGLHTPWKPSQPAMKSQASSRSSPPWRYRTVGRLAVEVVHAHVLGVVDRGGAARRARRHQVARDLGLAVDDHVLAAGEAVQVDALAAAGPADLDAGVDETLGMEARADAGFVEHRDGALFEHAGADAAEHVIAACAARR